MPTHTNPRDPNATFKKGNSPSAQDTAARKRAYLESLRTHGVIGRACQAIGITYSSSSNWRRDDPEFEEAVQEALQFAADEAEVELRRRAIEGAPQKLTYKGEIMYERNPLTGELELDDNFEPIPIWINQKSDRLLEVLVRAKNPDFRERKAFEMSGPGGKPLQTANLTEEELNKKLAQYGITAGPLEE